MSIDWRIALTYMFSKAPWAQADCELHKENLAMDRDWTKHYGNGANFKVMLTQMANLSKNLFLTSHSYVV